MNRKFGIKLDNIDFCIVGGGIVGLSVAYVLGQNGYQGAVLEGGPYFGDQSTGRNSGVLHAGLYYPKNSLKHLTCIDGNLLWRHWAQILRIPLNPCGKFVVARDSEERDTLDALYLRAQSNGVASVSWANRKNLEALSHFVKVDQAFFSGNSGVIDVPAAVTALRRQVESLGFLTLVNHIVQAIKPLGNEHVVSLKEGEIKARFVINCAGHGAVSLRRQLGLTELSPVMVKGTYLRLTKKLRHPWLIYPLPGKDGLGLGIHNVLEVDGALKFGPDTEPCENLDYQISQIAIDRIRESVHSFFYGIKPEELQPDLSGIRSRLLYNGEPYHDFWLKGPQDHQIPGYIELCGIDSPGLTAAPALANRVLLAALTN